MDLLTPSSPGGLLTTISSWLPWGGLPCLSSALSCQYRSICHFLITKKYITVIGLWFSLILCHFLITKKYVTVICLWFSLILSFTSCDTSMWRHLITFIVTCWNSAGLHTWRSRSRNCRTDMPDFYSFSLRWLLNSQDLKDDRRTIQ